MVFNYYKNKFFINISTVLIFLGLITTFIIYPVLTEISKVNHEITNERIKLEKKLALGLNIKQIIKDLEEIEVSAKNLDLVFIDKGQELEFVNTLETIASQYGIELEFNSDFIGEDIKDNIYQVEIQIILKGDYKQILKFINSTENTDNYFNIKLITISKDKKSGGSTVIAQLIANTYFKK